MLLSQSQIQQLYPQAESLVRHTRVGRTSHVSFNLTSFIFNRNFSRVSRGPEAGAYYHKFFLRDKPHHAAQMFCKNARSKLAMASTTSVDIERAQQPPLKQAEDTSSAGVANALEHPQQLGRQAPLPSQVQPPLPSSALLSAPAFQKLGFKERYEEQHSDQKQKQNNEIDLKSSLTPFASGGNSLQLLERQLQILQIEQTNRLMLEQAMSLQRQRQWQQGSSDAATSVAQLEQQQQLAQLQKSSKAVQFLQMRHFMQMQNRNQQARKPTKRGASAA